jgi:hypothetical protein
MESEDGDVQMILEANESQERSLNRIGSHQDLQKLTSRDENIKIEDV